MVLLERLNPDDLPAEPVITAVTLAELSAGPHATDGATERVRRQARLQEAEAAFDALIAATAIARDELTIIAVAHPDHS